jgi:hypothetical protein
MDEQTNDHIMHLDRLGKADRLARQACAWLELSHAPSWEAAAQRPPDWSIGGDCVPPHAAR